MNKWVVKGIHAVEDVKAMFKRILVDRKGGSTVEYVIVLAAAAALAAALMSAINSNKGTLTTKINSIFQQISGGK